MALRRLRALVIVTGAIVLGWVLLFSGGRTASASDVCTSFDISGDWTVNQGHYDYLVHFTQGQNGVLSGEMDFSASDVANLGYPPGTRFPITSGRISGGDQVTWEDTPTKPKTDGTGAHVGVYNGIVSERSDSQTAVIDGQTHDKATPASHGPFEAHGVALCLKHEPGPPELLGTIPPNKPKPADAAPGSDTAAAVKLDPTAMMMAATVSGATPQDAVVGVPTPGDPIRHACFITLVKNIAHFGHFSSSLSEADQNLAFDELAECLAFADEVDAYNAIHKVPAASDAGASRCAEVQMSVSRRNRRRVKIAVTHVGPRPKEPVTATCTFSGGKLKITMRSNKHGVPLRKLIGPRMQIGFFRSRQDAAGGHVTLTFTRH